MSNLNFNHKNGVYDLNLLPTDSEEHIAYMNFDNTLYEYIDNNLWNCNEEKMMSVLDHYFNTKNVECIPYLFNGGLDIKTNVYGRSGYEYHPYLELAYNALCYTDETKKQNCDKVYRIITYIMKRTNYHLYPQPKQLFEFLLIEEYCTEYYTNDLLNDDDKFILAYKFISAYNNKEKIKCKVETQYYNCNDEGCYQMLRSVLIIRHECKIMFSLLLNKLFFRDISNMIFDFLMPKIDLSNCGLSQNDQKLLQLKRKSKHVY